MDQDQELCLTILGILSQKDANGYNIIGPLSIILPKWVQDQLPKIPWVNIIDNNWDHEMEQCPNRQTIYTYYQTEIIIYRICTRSYLRVTSNIDRSTKIIYPDRLITYQDIYYWINTSSYLPLLVYTPRPSRPTKYNRDL